MELVFNLFKKKKKQLILQWEMELIYVELSTGFFAGFQVLLNL